MYEARTYREWVTSDDLFGFEVMVRETDLFIRAERDLSRQAIESINEYRGHIESYIEKDKEFQTSLRPHSVNNHAHPIVRQMAHACALVGVGPFASVAGAIAEYVGNDLLNHSKEVVIENGGDIFIKSLKDRLVAIYSGPSEFNGKIGIMIKANDTPMGICTSAGTVGHSLSFGKADAVVVLSKSVILADAAATSIANRVAAKDDINRALRFAKKIPRLKGVIIIKDDKMGAWGDVEISRL